MVIRPKVDHMARKLHCRVALGRLYMRVPKHTLLIDCLNIVMELWEKTGTAAGSIEVRCGKIRTTLARGRASILLVRKRVRDSGEDGNTGRIEILGICCWKFLAAVNFSVLEWLLLQNFPAPVM